MKRYIPIKGVLGGREFSTGIFPAVWKLLIGTDIELIMELLNHSSTRETLCYIGITQDEKDQAIRSLDL